MSALDLHVHVWEPGASLDAPVLLLLHGTGGDERDLLELGRMLSPGAALLSLRGNVLEQGAPRFFRRLAEGVFDVEDLHRRTDDLAQFIDAAAEKYEFPIERLCAVGFSNGANIAASVLLTHPQTLRRAILFRAMLPFEPETPPDLNGCAVMLSEGRMDPLIPPEMGERLATLLRSAGADVELVWQNGGHALASGDVRRGQEWLGRHGGR